MHDVFNLNDTQETQEPTESPKGRILYYDIETVPGKHAPTLELPELNPELYAADVVKGKIPEIKADLERMESKQIAAMLELEKAKEKPRAGVLEAVEKEAAKRAAAHGDWLKENSVNPLFCCIAAISWAVDDGDPITHICSDSAEEKSALTEWWTAIYNTQLRVGWNILAFDDTVVGVRSLAHELLIPQRLDRNRYRNNQALDLMHLADPAKWRKLKDFARAIGIEVPAGDTDGSDVYELWSGGDDEKLREYVESDVVISRELHLRLKKVFV